MKIKTGKRYFPDRTYLTHIFAVIFHRELTSTPTIYYKINILKRTRSQCVNKNQNVSKNAKDITECQRTLFAAKIQPSPGKTALKGEKSD